MQEDPTEFDWQLTQLDKGTGCTCPKCEGKLLVNIELVRETRRQLGLSSMTCPYCERVSMLPREAQPQRKRVRRPARV